MWWSAVTGTLMLPLRPVRSSMISPPAPRGEPLCSPCSNSLWRQQEGRSGLMRGRGRWDADFLAVEDSGALRGYGKDYRTLKCFLCSLEETRERFHTNLYWQTEVWGAGHHSCHSRPCLYLCLPTYPSSHTHTHTASIKPEQQGTHIHIPSHAISNYFSNCGVSRPTDIKQRQ